MDTPFPLGRRVEHDPLSRGFPAFTIASVPVTSKKWRRYGAVLDQGQTGSCTGNATIHSRNSAPNHKPLTPVYREPKAREVYARATEIDGFPGTWHTDGSGEDTGSSGLAAAKAAQQFGLIQSYSHAFGIDHFVRALMSGPLSVGMTWYNDMFYPDANGLIHPTGGEAGGHQVCCNGYNATSRVFRFQNSWGSGWGANGTFYLTWSDLDSLLGAQGDAIQFAV